MPHAANTTQRFAWMLALAVTVGLALAGSVHARSSDRNQPMNISSDQQIGSLEENAVNTWSGNVVINQGTLEIRSSKADIHQLGGEPVRAVLTGNQAILKQQMEDGSPMTAKADRIEYDMTKDVIVLIGNYTVTTARGSTNGQRLTYDLKSGRIDSGGQGNGRVTTTILPKSKQTPLKPAQPTTLPSTQKPN
jgi:lipopolysaccharide export system protein LptA